MKLSDIHEAICDLIFEETLSRKIILIKCLPLITHYSAIVLEVNEILITALPGYQISLTSCTKWWNDKQLKISV